MKNPGTPMVRARPKKPVESTRKTETLPDPDTAPETPEPTDEELEGLEEEAVHAPSTRALVPRAKSWEIAPGDALQAYMAEVNRHPLLTREEEQTLALRFRETGDVAAAYRLVASNLRLVVKLAHQYHRNPLSLLDLIQEGNIGLMQAVKKYDPGRGVKLSSYAVWWIRAYILRFIIDNWKMVKLGTTEAQRKLFFKLRQEQERLMAQGFEPTPRLLAERLAVSEQDVVEMDQRLGHDELSLDAPVSDEDRSPRASRLAQTDWIPPDETLGNEELKALVREELALVRKTLGEKELFLFEKRLLADEPLTLQEVGNHFGVSRERARQLEVQLVDKIRERLRERIPDFDLVALPKR